MEYPQSTNTLWHKITYLTQGTTWPVEVFERLVHMLHYPTSNDISVLIPVLFSLCYSHQPLYHELKRPASNIALTWPGRRADHLQKNACGLFVMCCCCLLVLLLTTASTNAVWHWTSFQVTCHDRLSLGSFCCLGVTLIPAHTTMNWGHMARASVLGAGGDSCI